MRNFNEIVSSVNRLRHDIKAEAIIADIIENGLTTSNIVVYPEGLFRRRFNQDISDAEVKKLENGQEVLEFHITRDGIYDTLPAGIFHDHPKESANNGGEMANHSKKQRLIEKYARLLFQPFENEIFLKQIELELEERKIITRFNENLFDDIFSEFWKMDITLPQKLLSRLILLLHLTHKITGNFELMARTLEIIIEETVKIKLNYAEHHNDIYNDNPVDDGGILGASAVGVDFVSGKLHNSTIPELVFEIGPIKNSSIEDYMGNGQISRFLDCFFGYFVPIEMDVSTKIIVNEEEMDFTLDPASSPVLGYNSSI
jgi:hypothetical protein